MQNNIFRLDIKSKLKEEDGLGILGSVVNLDVVKSRTNTSDRAKCSLVFDQATGYDNDLSLFYMLKDRKLLEGSGAFLKLPGCDIKFSQKKFKEKLRENEEFRKIFMEACFEVLQTLINDPGEIEEDDGFDITSMMLNDANIQFVA